MQRRKYLATVGSLAAGAAAVMGSSAFAVTRVNRAVNVNVAGDASAYLGLDASISEYANQQSNGELELAFDGSGGQNGEGLNPNSDTSFHNVFRIENNGTNSVRVQLAGADNSQNYPDDSPMVLTYTSSPDDSTTLTDQTAFPDSPNPLGDVSWGPQGPNDPNAPSGFLELDPGESAYVHIHFYLRDDNPNTSEVTRDASAIPSELGFYVSALPDTDGL